MKLLLVEDSERLQRSLTQGLQHSGFTVDATGDGLAAMSFVGTYDYDVLILDLMLPGLDGWSVLRRLRQERRSVPVLVLSARDRPSDRVDVLNLGADDYLVKPFAFDELVARIRAISRRRYGSLTAQLCAGALCFDTVRRVATLDGVELDLSARESKLLEVLLTHPNRVLTQRQIEDRLYDSNSEHASNVIEAAVCSLRKRIAHHPDAPLILTRRGRGYELATRELQHVGHA